MFHISKLRASDRIGVYPLATWVAWTNLSTELLEPLEGIPHVAGQGFSIDLS